LEGRTGSCLACGVADDRLFESTAVDCLHHTHLGSSCIRDSASSCSGTTGAKCKR
jgi:hypothetical protein